MKSFEWTFWAITFGVIVVIVEAVILWPKVCRAADDRLTGRVRPGCAVFFFLGLICSFFGAVGMVTVRRQASRMVVVKADCLSVLDATSLRVALVEGGAQITVRLLAVAPFTDDADGEAMKHLTEELAPPGTRVTLRLPEGTILEADEVTGYVFTGSSSNSEFGYRLLLAGLVRRDMDVAHHIVTLQSAYEFAEITAKREGHGLWKERNE